MGRSGSVVSRWERVSATQGVEGLCEEVFPGIGRVELKKTRRTLNAHDGTDLEQLETDGIDLSPGRLRASEAQHSLRSASISV